MTRVSLVPLGLEQIVHGPPSGTRNSSGFDCN